MMFLPIFFLALPTLISTSSEKTYQFGIVDGAPESLNGSSNFSAGISNFRDCVSKCESDVTCILAYQETDSAPCFLFEWNSVTQVRDNASGGEGKVAFRLYTDQPVCDLNLEYLLNGKTYQLLANNTNEYLWTIDTSESGWNITYIGCNQDDTVTCMDWNFERPYADGCTSDCLLTMIQFYAEPGLLTGTPPGHQNDTKTWRDCMLECYYDIECITVFYDENTLQCEWFYDDGWLYFMNKTSATSGKRAALKAELNNKTCKYTTDQLLDDVYYTSKTKIRSSYNMGHQTNFLEEKVYPFYRIRTFADNYQIDYYSNASINFTFYDEAKGKNASLCQPWFVPIFEQPAACYRPLNSDVGLTHQQATSVCAQLGGVLMVQFSKTFPIQLYKLGYANYGYHVPQTLAWMGLTRSDNSTTWTWTRPELASDPSAFAWAAGQPDMSAGKNCVYLNISDGNAAGFGYLVTGGFVTTECSDTQNRGLICETPTQQAMGIKDFTDVWAEYGYGSNN